MSKRPVAFRWQNLAGVWCFSADEEHAAKMSDSYQGLYVRDGMPEPDPWAHIPEHYKGRWGFDYDDKRGFFVHCNGYGICTAEDSEVCDAICRAYNAQSA